jgi:hypothetical protein
VTSVSENDFETHAVEMSGSGDRAALRIRRQKFDPGELSSLNVSEQEDKLRKECSTLANRLARELQDRGKSVSIRDVHASAKKRFKKSQKEMPLALLKKKKQWLKRCLQMKRLV